MKSKKTIKKGISLFVACIFMLQTPVFSQNISIDDHKMLQVRSFFENNSGFAEIEAFMAQIRRMFKSVHELEHCFEPVVNGVNLSIDFENKFYSNGEIVVPCYVQRKNGKVFFDMFFDNILDISYESITEEEYYRQTNARILDETISDDAGTSIDVPDLVSILDQAEYNMQRIADQMQLDKKLRDKMFSPERVTTVNFELEMDDGEIIKFWAFRALQNSARGAGKGGLRWLVGTGETLDEAKETAVGLATLMTVKNATVGIPYGGGKGDVFVPFREYTDNDKAKIIRAFARELTVAKAVGTFIDVPAPDKGTDARMMAWFVEEHIKVLCENGELTDKILQKRLLEHLDNINGDKINLQETPLLDHAIMLLEKDVKSEYFLPELGVVTGKPVGQGGALGRTEATGYGGFLAFKAVREALLKSDNTVVMGQYNEKTKAVIKKEIKELTVGVQGTGNVGEYKIRNLYKEGAKIILLQDVSFEKGDDGKVKVIPYTLYLPQGLNLSVFDSFMPHRKDGRWPELKTLPKEFFEVHPGSQLIKGDTEFFWKTHTNIKVAGATENQIFAANAENINCEILLELANCPTTPQADNILKKRGILVIPDVLANVGGVTVSYFEWLQNLEGKYWTLLAVNEMLEERIYNEVEDVFRIAAQYNISLRDAAFRLSLSRVADAEIARDKDLQRFFRKNVPYQGYNKLGLAPETNEGLKMFNEQGLYQALIDKEESKHKVFFEKETENIFNRFHGKGGFLMISGPQSGGKIEVAHRFANELSQKGMEPIYIDSDRQTLKMEKILREQGKTETQIYNARIESIKQLLIALDRGEEVEILVNGSTGEKNSSTQKISKKENTVFIIEGDLALDDVFLSQKEGVLKDNNTYAVFVNVAPSLKVTDNWPLTSLDLRLIRQILTENYLFGNDPLDVIRQWPLVRQVNINYTYPAWKNADSTFNSYLAYELPILKPFIEKQLAEAFLEAIEQKDQKAIKVIEHLLHILRDVSPAGGNIPEDSIIRQCIGTKPTEDASNYTYLRGILDKMTVKELSHDELMKDVMERIVDIRDALYFTMDNKVIAELKKQTQDLLKQLNKRKELIIAQYEKDDLFSKIDQVNECIAIVKQAIDALGQKTAAEKNKGIEKILMDNKLKYSQLVTDLDKEIDMRVPESISVLDNTTDRKNIIDLRIVNAFNLDIVARSKSSKALNRWFTYQGGIHPEHVPYITDIQLYLKNNDEKLQDVFFVLSSDGQDIEAFVDLSTKRSLNVSVMETAPWNRTEDNTCKYKGVGSETRVFAIKKLHEIYGESLYEHPLMSRVLTLGHRNSKASDVFDHETAKKQDVEKYIKQQDALQYTNRLFFGKGMGTKPVSDQKTFFDKWEEPDVLYKHMVELISSVVLSGKKLVLNIDKNISGPDAVRVKTLMKKLKIWSEVIAEGDPNLSSIFKNVYIFEFDEPSQIKSMCEKENIDITDTQHNMIFSFSSNYTDQDLAENTGYIKTVYLDIDGKDMLDSYLPLFEIIMLSVAKEFKKYDTAYIKQMFETTAMGLSDLNIQDIVETKDGSLIFYIIPKANKYDHNSRVDRYARLLNILSAA
ncbi:MAG: Glu/Leu/Phe/Val dehydrogenase dimerization domain-containing protein [Candidatus Omnitrophica bacterium]|nr:Glu/Leu/Phe/Val dehydrogenase dimerization domain-containing protein [Candidatus Omnitrophota bacterium]